MDNKEMLKKLRKLHQLDFDAVKAYEEAIERISNPRIKQQLTEYKNEHIEHLERLEQLIVAKGDKKPERKRDLKGILIEGMTLLRSAMGDEQALKAMKQNEEVTNKKYSEALKDFHSDKEAMKVINRHYADEKKHLAFIKEALEHPQHFKDDGGESVSASM